ncbi:DUF3352 domain-containing protein [Kribbella sandramycini]|uniref:DUF3352 domain-containing protein n=1 Tax=Kribbella sandramycini TaxID=60450 RepID=A0A7Y4NYD5_9ACTN|nr:DUF3352 domain-containing protein [Kribbella sandramycini]MBB6568591.1 hypothetical protein [Kribbella sandramycini]NOL38824.1 DUF3352 domain-containing protein [Kribbella sandramycini]
MSDQFNPPGPQSQGPGGQQYPGNQPQPPYQGQQPGQPQFQGQPPYQGEQSFEQLQFGAQGQQPPAKKPRGKLIPIIAALAMVLVVAGGGIFAYGKLNGGKQPDAVLPGTAIGFLRVDLNPSAGQKLAALRFLMKFPSAKDKLKLTGEKDDLHQKLFEAIKSSSGDDLAEVDYAKDVKPWLGDRIGAAVLPTADGQKEPPVVIAVQVKDEKAAAKGMDKLLAKETEKPGRAFHEDYMILADKQADVDAAIATAKTNPLTNNAKYTDDLKKLGEPGFATVWADVKGLSALAGEFGPAKVDPVGEGTVAAALRFDAQYVEVKGIVKADQEVVAKSADAGELFTKLPDTTTAAMTVSGVDTSIDTLWKQLEKSGELGEMVKGFGSASGLTLPDDLKNLLGKNLSLVVDKDASAGPKFAARLETDPAKAEPVLKKLTTLMQQQAPVQVPLVTAKDGDTLVVSTDQAYAGQVLQGGNLGATENFKVALPDVQGATMLGYVDFTAAADIMEALDEKPNADVQALRSAGIVARNTGNFEGDFTLRVVAK